MIVFAILLMIAGLICLIVSLVKFFGENSDSKSGVIILVVSIILGVIGMLITAPWWHWLFVGLIYKAAPFWITTVVIFGLGLLGFFIVRTKPANKPSLSREQRGGYGSSRNYRETNYSNNEKKGGAGFIWSALAVWIVFAIIMGCTWSAALHCKVYEKLKPQSISQLYETTEIRYLPMEVAETYGKNKVQESEIVLGNFEPIIYNDGKLDWVAPRIPNGFWRSLLSQADGFALIKSDGSVKMVNQTMTYGEGMYVEDNIFWQLHFKKYFVDVPEIYYTYDESTKEVLGVAPYLGYKMDYPIMMPYWEGVFVFHSNGKIEEFTPEQAQALPYLKGQRIFPEDLAKLQVESWAYKYGAWTYWFDNRDKIQIPNIHNSSNQMPYLIPTSNGPKWFVATEPVGSSYGVFKIFFVDAHSGLFEIYELPKDSALIGPNRGWEYIKSARSDIKWGNITILEPRPVVNKGTLYWMVSLTSVSESGYGSVGETFLVNAKTTEVLSFKTEQEVRNFVEKGIVQAAPIVKTTNISGQTTTIQTLVVLANNYFAEYQKLTGAGKWNEAAQALENLQATLKAMESVIKK